MNAVAVAADALHDPGQPRGWCRAQRTTVSHTASEARAMPTGAARPHQKTAGVQPGAAARRPQKRGRGRQAASLVWRLRLGRLLPSGAACALHPTGGEAAMWNAAFGSPHMCERHRFISVEPWVKTPSELLCASWPQVSSPEDISNFDSTNTDAGWANLKNRHNVASDAFADF